MTKHRFPHPPLPVCANCGDDMVIVAHYLPSGHPLCADCTGPGMDAARPEPTAPTTERETPRATANDGGVIGPMTSDAPVDRAPSDLSNDLHRMHDDSNAARDGGSQAPVGGEAEGNGGGSLAGISSDRAPSCSVPGCMRVGGHRGFHATSYDLAKREDEVDAQEADIQNDPRNFVLAEDAQDLVLEVEEWVYQKAWVQVDLLATPSDLYRDVAARAEERTSSFVVVLEWTPRHGTRVMRDIGPMFSSIDGARQSALRAAQAFARLQAHRLKAMGPFGYRPAREIPEVADAAVPKPSVDESAHDSRSQASPAAPGAAVVVPAPAGPTEGEDHGA